jgi:hypothetical protein
MDEKCNIGIDEGSLLLAGDPLYFPDHYDCEISWSACTWSLSQKEGKKEQREKEQAPDGAETLPHIAHLRKYRRS